MFVPQPENKVKFTPVTPTTTILALQQIPFQLQHRTTLDVLIKMGSQIFKNTLL